MTGFNTKVTPEIEKLTQICKDHTTIDLSLYGKYDVKKGLPDINGKGVLAALTQVSKVQAVKVVDGKEVEMHVKEGDQVIYSKYAGTEVELDEESYIIVSQSDILAVIE